MMTISSQRKATRRRINNTNSCSRWNCNSNKNDSSSSNNACRSNSSGIWLTMYYIAVIVISFSSTSSVDGWTTPTIISTSSFLQRAWSTHKNHDNNQHNLLDTTSKRRIRSCCNLLPGGTDLSITFGSDATKNISGGVNWGDDDSYEIERTNQHNEKVQALLNVNDDQLKTLRKQTLWGNYANVTSMNELQRRIDEEQSTIQMEFTRQQQLAQQQGVVLEVLQPKEDDLMLSLESGGEDNAGNVQIQPGLTSKFSWFAEMDEELRSEWDELTSQDDTSIKKVNKVKDDVDEENGDEFIDPENDSLGKESKKKSGKKESMPSDVTTTTSSSPFIDDRVVQSKTTGKIITRDALSGIRVGSAGGWTLEVFPGDFVVHRKYGIGRFERTCLKSKTKLSRAEKQAQDQRRADILTYELRKLQKNITTADIQAIRTKFGTAEDMDPISNPQITVLEITYTDATVHVPVDRAYRLSRYRAGDAVVKPRLSRVKGEAWTKMKRKVEENTLALAQDVLALYATRETLIRQPFDPSLESVVQQFANATFQYTPTSDQIKCFEDIENDMIWRSRPMDRLICGDVGFGKTEVAIRALYRACINGKQCALLAPTGVLAAQHYKNIMKRMGHYNISCTLLRGGMGKNTKIGREIRDNIATGQIQLIVGTHALLSNDLQFNSLGLLVVDEEQRFGVKQKERLKLIANGVDVLTLSATPIPRTLQMSLSGIRDTSTIRSPPPMRKRVITYVQDFNEELVQTAIATELQRGGQCYYVVPRISMLDDAEALIQKLFPSVRVIQAHGRMHRNGAEENVAAFAEGRYDVLLATTVIENGVDIPTVNTIVVQNSQAFGMSTLYQLRGRVGRSDQQAYAYFLHRDESITEQAALRLQAIGELNELGSGFDVANRDLEIRGAGSLLGTEQSGVASKVGFDLYMRLLKKSIRKLRGLDLPTVPRTNILLNNNDCDGSTQSNSFQIPASYIQDDDERLSEETKARLAESTSALVDLTNSWKERFGAIPASVQNQLKTMHLHACTRRLGIDLVGLIDTGIEIEQENTDNDDDTAQLTRKDIILRSPGLRPRHWGAILSTLPKMAMPRGFDVIFPARFAMTGEELEVEGGRVIDINTLVRDDNDYDDNNDEDWDAMDDEELEAMKDISSAANVQNIDEIDIEQYPRFIIKGNPSIDKVLKFLLPIAKIVHEKQGEQASFAKSAVALREKQETMKQRKKNLDTTEAIRLGYRY